MISSVAAFCTDDDGEKELFLEPGNDHMKVLAREISINLYQTVSFAMYEFPDFLLILCLFFKNSLLLLNKCRRTRDYRFHVIVSMVSSRRAPQPCLGRCSVSYRTQVTRGSTWVDSDPPAGSQSSSSQAEGREQMHVLATVTGYYVALGNPI
jgi:ABC-type arginine transport system permease subunit